MVDVLDTHNHTGFGTRFPGNRSTVSLGRVPSKVGNSPRWSFPFQPLRDAVLLCIRANATDLARQYLVVSLAVGDLER